jgi:carboxymethylenebutenolidase
LNEGAAGAGTAVSGAGAAETKPCGSDEVQPAIASPSRAGTNRYFILDLAFPAIFQTVTELARAPGHLPAFFPARNFERPAGPAACPEAGRLYLSRHGSKGDGRMAKQDIEIRTEDGAARAGLFAPAGGVSGARAGVILYMDAFGPRPALDTMAVRLADEGYFVLVPDLFYRSGAYGPFDARTAFSKEETGNLIRGMIAGTTQDMTMRDSGAFIRALTDHGATGPIGTVGYCMGGGRALNAAAAWPDRIQAAASFHGGNLAGDAPDTPAHNAGRIKARVYVGVAGVDKSFPPEQSGRLAEALRTAEVDHAIENYVGMAHGWCVPDHSVYDENGAERHWKRLTVFFAETLGGRERKPGA